MSDDPKKLLAVARAEYSAQRQQFDAVLSFAVQACEGIRNATARNDAGNVAVVLFDKAVMHAKSLGKVVPSVPGPVTQDHDLGSAAVLVRAIAETFLAYWYTCREPKTSEDFEFRDALLSYHRLTRLAATAPLYRWVDGDGDSVLRSLLKEARVRLEADPFFRRQPASTQVRQLDGREFAHRQLVDIARSAGISEWFWHCTYKYLSQFNHAAPFSVVELSRFDPEQARAPQLLAMVLRFACGYLARFTFDVHNNYFKGLKSPVMDVEAVALLGSLMLVLETNLPPQSWDKSWDKSGERRGDEGAGSPRRISP